MAHTARARSNAYGAHAAGARTPRSLTYLSVYLSVYLYAAGERTLRSLNNVIMQTNLRKQQMGVMLLCYSQYKNSFHSEQLP